MVGYLLTFDRCWFFSLFPSVMTGTLDVWLTSCWTPARDASEPPCAEGAAAVPGRGAQRRSSAAAEGAAGGAPVRSRQFRRGFTPHWDHLGDV